ncbi:MAG: fibronectin, partial [Lachnospiraceae bacterium]
MYKRILAAILAAALSFGTLSDAGTVYAKNTSITDTQQAESLAKMEDNLSLNATNSFGNLLVNAIDGEAKEQEENEGNNIFSIEMSGTQATVSFETVEEDASLIVGIYDEAGIAMLASGSLEVTREDTSAVVEIETEDMPQYFYIKGFLVEPDTLRPLCTMYESPNYTQEMQEFLSKTTEDFDEEKVLNLDEDTSNNFAVYGEDTHIIKQSESTNEVISADDENQVYVIENADESITSLQQGDIFSYEYEDGTVLLVKVGSITLDGITATITGADTSMEEVFAYVKIDAEASTEDAQVDASSLEEGVIYEGMTEDTGEVPALGASEGEATYEKSLSFKFIDKKLGSENNNVTLSGGLELKLANTVKFYISTSYQYLELKIGYSAKVNISVSGQGNGEIPLAFIGISPVPGVYIEFTPSFVAQVNAKVNAIGQLSGVVGYSVSNDEGIKSLTSMPTFKSELKGELTLYVGLSLEPKIKIISDKIAKASMKATAGAEVKGTMLLYEPASSSKKHDCKQCIDGDIRGKCELEFGATLLNWDKLDFKYTKNFSVKIFDFYYSFDYNQFAFTECPHLSYRVDVTVVDSAGNPVEGAKINGQYGTDKNGSASLWLNIGSHAL